MKFYQKYCSFCHGSGSFLKDKCPNCDGSGIIDSKKIMQSMIHNKKKLIESGKLDNYPLTKQNFINNLIKIEKELTVLLTKEEKEEEQGVLFV